MNKLVFLAVAGLGTTAAQAQTCPADASVSTVMAANFSCTVGDKTFSAFNITGAPATAIVEFGQFGPLFALSLDRDGGFFADGRLVFDYKITAAAPLTIRQGSVGVDVSFPLVVTTTTMNGILLSPGLRNGGTAVVDFTPGVGSLIVDNTAIISGPAELNSLTNDFAQQIVGVGVPEPGTLALMLLGTGGVVLSAIRRRHRP